MQVQAYRNLNTGLWSVRAKVDNGWRVIAHCERVALKDVSVRQSEASRQRVIREQRRNVHCWINGELISCDGVDRKRDINLPEGADTPYLQLQGRGVTYNPYHHRSLVHRDDESEYAGGAYAVLDVDQNMYV
jgi:hypothetical protein